MNCKEVLKKAIEIQRGFRGLRSNSSVMAINDGYIQVREGFFYELVGRGLVKIIEEKQDDEDPKEYHVKGIVKSEDDISVEHIEIHTVETREEPDADKDDYLP